MKRRVKKETFWMLCNLTKGLYLSQTSLSQISTYIQIYITMETCFFWKGIQQFSYCSKASKETKSKIVCIRKLPLKATLVLWDFLQNLSKIIVKESKVILQCRRLYTRSFAKKGTLRHLQGHSSTFFWKNVEKMFLVLNSL